MFIFCGIVIAIASVMLYKSTYGVYKHNRLHEHWETRIVKTETGFNGKSDYDNLDDALKAKEEYDKKAFEWVHRDNVTEVIVGAKE